MFVSGVSVSVVLVSTAFVSGILVSEAFVSEMSVLLFPQDTTEEVKSSAAKIKDKMRFIKSYSSYNKSSSF